MPRLDNLPALEVIRGLKGVLDFYYWRGIPCVRKWPVIPPASRTPASLASAALFGAVVQGYSLLGGTLKLLFSEDAADHPRTARDLYVSATLGHLHEINMDEVIALLEQNNAYLLALQDVLNTLNSIGTDLLLTMPGNDGANPQQLLVDAQRHLQTDVLASALPTDAATAAHQITQNTSLALIEKLEAALASVDTDILKVRGENQFFSLKGVLSELKPGSLSANNGYVTSSACSADEYWIVTNVCAYNADNPATRIFFQLLHDGAPNNFYYLTQAIPALEAHCWGGHIILDPGDTLRAYFVGGQAGDSATIMISGYTMTCD